MAQIVKNLPAMWETWVRSLGQEDPLAKGMAAHFSVLACRIPWTEEPGGLQSMGSQRVRHDAAAAKSRQSCPTLCDAIDSSPPGSPVLGIFQPRVLEWVATVFSGHHTGYCVKLQVLVNILHPLGSGQYNDQRKSSVYIAFVEYE